MQESLRTILRQINIDIPGCTQLHLNFRNKPSMCSYQTDKKRRESIKIVKHGQIKKQLSLQYMLPEVNIGNRAARNPLW